jgi:hypothetical protein
MLPPSAAAVISPSSLPLTKNHEKAICFTRECADAIAESLYMEDDGTL